jgi:hypothetical protein
VFGKREVLKMENVFEILKIIFKIGFGLIGFGCLSGFATKSFSLSWFNTMWFNVVS